MNDTKGYVESRQLSKGGYLQEIEVEPRGKAGVLSIPSTSEMELKKRLKDLSNLNKNIQEFGIFRGAGIYNHYIPALVYSLASNRNFLTAYSYILSMGKEGLKKASEVAPLNANYLKNKLSKFLDIAYPSVCKHEFVVKGSSLKQY